MLERIIAAALHHRLLVLVAALAVALAGTWTGSRLTMDVLPDLNRPRVTVLTEAPGLLPEDMERRIALPLERVLAGAPGLVRTKTSCGMGLCAIHLDFDWGTDIYRNRQVVQERLALAQGQMPDGAAPRMAPIASLMGQVQIIGLRYRPDPRATSQPTEVSVGRLSELRSIAEQVVRFRLLAVPGIAQVVVAGGAPRQLQVELDADLLRLHAVGVAEVVAAIRASSAVESGGLVDVVSHGLLVQIDGLLQGERDLAAAVVRTGPGRPIKIGDLGAVRFGPAAVLNGDAGVDGHRGVLLVVYKQPQTDTLDLTRRIDAETRRIQTALPADVELVAGVYRQADFIQRAVDNVAEAVWLGALLTLVVMLVFLANLRTTLITLVAIPLSIATTAIVFSWMGIGLNTMTLGGLAVAIGALVDDAIVDVENVFRRLRQNRERPAPRRALTIVFEASCEIRQPILIGTLVVAVVYLPLLALGGMEGRLFRPIGIAYITSILASLVVALTVTPVLCHLLLPRCRAMEHRRDTWLVVGLKRLARVVIDGSLAAPRAILLGLLALVGGLLLLLWTRGTEFLPPFQEGTALVSVALPPGTNLSHASHVGRQAEQAARRVDGVANVARLTGRADEDEHADPIQFSHIFVNLEPKLARSRDAVLAEIRRKVQESCPGALIGAEQPLAHLLSHLLSGVNAQVAIKVRGPDLSTLRSAAEQVRQAIAGVSGVTDVFVEQQQLVQSISIRPQRELLARHGLRASDVVAAVGAMLHGETITTLQQGEFRLPVVLRVGDASRRDLEALRRLPVATPMGGTLLLADLATVELVRTPNSVGREDGQRQIVVQHNVSGVALGDVAATIESRLDAVRPSLPAGTSLRLSGQFEAQAQASRLILWLSLLSLLLMSMLIYSHFRSVNLVLQTLLNVPMAFVGAVVLLLWTNQNISVATLVGLISLGGIAVRNKILLLDHYLHLAVAEKVPFSRDLIQRAGQERIVPVLMTALTSGIALLPLVLFPGRPGLELLYPVACVIVGGLVTTTILDMLLTPGVFFLFGRAAVERRLQRDVEA